MATPVLNLDAIKDAVRALDREFIAHANSGDATGMVEAFYAQDAQLLPPNMPKISGKGAILEFWKAFIAAGARDLDLETTDISASGDLIYGIGGYAFTLAGNRQEGKYLIVLRRQADGEYRAVADMFSANS